MDQLGNYTYDIIHSKKSSNYNATDQYIKDLMNNYIDEWCSNFNIHQANVLNMNQPGYLHAGINISLDDGATIFNTFRSKYRNNG